MKVLLLNIDSKLPNIALRKLELYHEAQGDEIHWDLPMMLDQVDRAYASCIFTKNKAQVDNYKGLRPDLIAGGTGYDYNVTLPYEVDAIKLRINYGFTTRGCIRNCSFCLVPKAEGNIRAVGDIYDIWDGKSRELTLLDNNILALPDHFKMICQQLIKEKLKVDFNQGLDIRLVTEDIARLLRTVSIKEHLRFSFDHPSLEMGFRKGIETMIKFIPASRLMIYVLIGYDTTFDEDMYRIQLIRDYGCDAFAMLYNGKGNRLLRELQGWNNLFYFRNMKFTDFLKYRKIEHLWLSHHN